MTTWGILRTSIMFRMSKRDIHPASNIDHNHPTPNKRSFQSIIPSQSSHSSFNPPSFPLYNLLSQSPSFLAYIIVHFIIQMIVPERDSFTSVIRKLCEEIESQVTSLLKKTLPTLTASPGTRTDPIRSQFQRTCEELNRAVIQTLTSRLPALITLEQETNDREEDLQFQLQELRDKHKRIYSQFQGLQLQNDRLKVEAVALSDSYEGLVVCYEEMKFKYHEMQEQRCQMQIQMQGHGGYQERLAELNLLSRDSNTNSVDSDRSPPPEPSSYPHSRSNRGSAEILAEQRQLFLQSIRDSQHQIVSFRERIQQLQAERESHLAQMESLSQLLQGEKERSDRFDKEMMMVLNKNQELKLELLEERERVLRGKDELEEREQLLREEEAKVQEAERYGEGLNSQLVEIKREMTQLKLENSQLRESIVLIEGRQRQLKTKNMDSKRQNQQLRGELQKMMIRLQQTTSSLQLRKQEQSLKLRHELQEVRSRAVHFQKQAKTTHSQRIHEISKMHKEITLKLQQKIQLLERGGKQKRDKITQLKFEVERLYESLQMQVQKEYKAVDKEKELNERIGGLQGRVKIAQDKAGKAQEQLKRSQEHSKTAKQQLTKVGLKLKRITDFTSKLRCSILPSLRDEVHSLKLLCQHLSAMLQMERQQTAFLLNSKQEAARQTMEQFLLQRSLTKEQTTLSHQNQIVRWKENCRNYEERYDQLKASFQMLEERHSKLEAGHAQTLRTHAEREAVLYDENERRKAEHASTLKTVQKLKEKCRQVQQYYKLVDELSKQNLILKGKLDSVSTFSFKSPQKQPQYQHQALDSTSKRNKFTLQDPLARFNRTSANFPPRSREDISVNDLTAKAEFQKQRLEAARREYNLINRPEP